MSLTIAVQEALVSILCYDKQNSSVVKGLLPANIFDPFYSDLVSEAHQFIDKYETIPDEHTFDLVQTLKARKASSAEMFDRIYLSLQTTRQSITSIDYIIDQAEKFARRQRIQASIGKAIEKLDEDASDMGVVQAEAILNSGLNQSFALFNKGLLLNDPEQALRFLEKRDSEQILTGIKELDKRGIVPTRKRLMLFLALYGKGKSWFCAFLLKQALLQRKRVLYVTCEMTDDETAQRALSSIFAVTKRREDVTYLEFEKDDLNRFVSIKPVDVPVRPSYADDDIKSVLSKKIRGLQGSPKAWIKHYPPNVLTLEGLNAYLDAMEMTDSFIPDLLIVDYPDQMAYDARYEKQELSRIYKGLRAIGIERDIAVVAPTQANREAEGAKRLTGKHIGLDFSKIQTADFALAYGQTDSEYELGLARLFVAKGRSDKDRFEIVISQSYDLGQFSVDSAILSGKTYWSTLKRREGEKVDDEEKHDPEPKPQRRRRLEEE